MIHILPTTPPEVNGLADYCQQLHKYWPDGARDWWVASPRVTAGAGEAWPGVRFNQFDSNAPSLESALAQSHQKLAVLHYVGYGYDPRGVPDWLPEGLAKWKSTGGRLVTMFHEIYASGPPWKSEFWLKKRQVRLAQELVDLSDRWITSCVDWHDRLVREFGADAARGKLIPISSAIDPIHKREPAAWPLEAKTQLNVAVFGFPRTRLRSIQAHRGLLHVLADRGHIHRVYLMGKSPGPEEAKEIEAALAQIGVIGRSEVCYDASPEELSRRFSECTLALTYYPYGILDKSSAFAAYAVHDLLTLIPPDVKSGDGPFLVNDDSRPEICYTALQKAPKPVDSSKYLSSKVAEQFAVEISKTCASS